METSIQGRCHPANEGLRRAGCWLQGLGATPLLRRRITRSSQRRIALRGRFASRRHKPLCLSDLHQGKERAVSRKRGLNNLKPSARLWLKASQR